MGPCVIHIIAGPAGAGKSTLCRTLQEHATTLGGSRRRRRIHVANMDPAADNNEDDDALYTIDVRDCITVNEVMTELGLGPNGALIYCMEYLLENFGWFQEQLETYLSDEDDYILLDCPGQLELYTHVPVLPRLIETLRQSGYVVASTFCVDAASCLGGDGAKFVSASLLCLSAMVALETPHVNVLTKCDLMPEKVVENFLEQTSALQLVQDELEQSTSSNGSSGRLSSRRQWPLTQAIAQVLDDYSMVSFVPLDIRDEESIDHVLTIMDHVVQYGEDAEVYGATHDDFDNDGQDVDDDDDHNND